MKTMKNIRAGGIAAAVLVGLCLAAGCSVQGASNEDSSQSAFPLSLVVYGPGTVSGLPESAEAGTPVTFRAENTRGDAETVSATLTVGSGAPLALNKENGAFVFTMPKRSATLTVAFSLVFQYDDAALSAAQTLYVKTATNETFLLSKDNNDWTDAPQGYLASDVVALDALSDNRAVVVTTEAALEPVSPVQLRFSGANLSSTGRAPLSIKDGAAALVTMEGSNSFLPGTNGSAGILVTPGSALTLTGPQGAALTVTGRGGNSGTASAGIGGAGYSAGGDITITGQIKVTATGGYNAPGIGAGFGTYGGTLTIGGGAEVTAQGGHGAAGIGGGYDGGGGTIIIQENAVVRATGSNSASGGAGIGAGSTNGAAVGVNVTIKDNATVIARGKQYQTGIGGLGKDAGGIEITILGNARVYGEAGTMDSAGLGGADGDNGWVSGAKITIGDGRDNPLVIARGSAGTDSGADGMGSGLGGGGATKASKVYIEIKSGTVIAQSNRAGGAAIGAQNPSADSYVKIAGGAVYTFTPDAAPVLTRPAASGADGATPVYPLYAPAGVSGPIRVPFAGASYEAPVIDSRVTDFITLCGLAADSDLSGLSALASELWVPAGSYSAVNAGASVKSAAVDAAFPAYSPGMTHNVLQ
jgi:hypothetical protein